MPIPRPKRPKMTKKERQKLRNEKVAELVKKKMTTILNEMKSKRIVQLNQNVSNLLEKRFIGSSVMDANYGYICNVLELDLIKFQKTKSSFVEIVNLLLRKQRRPNNWFVFLPSFNNSSKSLSSLKILFFHSFMHICTSP